MPDRTSYIAEVSEERIFGIALFFFPFKRIFICWLFTAFIFAHVFFASFSESSAMAQMNSFDQCVLNVHCVPDIALGR